MITKTRKIYLINQVNAQKSVFVKIFGVSVINPLKKLSFFHTSRVESAKNAKSYAQCGTRQLRQRRWARGRK